MAHHTPLAAWLYSNKQILDPKFREFDWTEKYLPGIHDFMATIRWNGMEGEGRGLADSRELALEKASAEAIERLICRILNLDSVGMAVSGNQDPKTHARNELYERFFLDSHLNMSIPMQALKGQFGDRSQIVDAFKRRNSEVGLQFFKFSTPADFNGVVCMIDNQRKSLGFALGTNFEDVIFRSFLEALPNFAWFQDRRDVLEAALPTSKLPWHLSDKFLTEIVPLLGGGDDRTTAIPLPRVTEASVDISAIPIFKDSPIRVARFIVSSEGQK